MARKKKIAMDVLGEPIKIAYWNLADLEYNRYVFSNEGVWHVRKGYFKEFIDFIKVAGYEPIEYILN